MKKILLILMFWIPLKAIAPNSSAFCVLIKQQPINIYESLWDAVCNVESGKNPMIINISEQAYGIAQIRQCRIDHFNRLTGKDYKLIDCLDAEISKEVFMYFAHGDFETVAKNWNGSGYKTSIYWVKVKNQLDVGKKNL